MIYEFLERIDVGLCWFLAAFQVLQLTDVSPAGEFCGLQRGMDLTTLTSCDALAPRLVAKQLDSGRFFGD